MPRIGPKRVALAAMAIMAMSIPLSYGQLPSLTGPYALTEADVTAKADVSMTTVRPGQSFHVAVELTVRDGLWLYSPTPRGKLVQPKPLRVDTTAGDWAVGEPRFPEPAWHTVTIAGETDSNLVYEGSLTVYIPIEAGPAPPTGVQSISIRITGQTCDDRGCYLVDIRAETSVRIAGPGAVAANDMGPSIPAESRTPAQWDASLAREPAGTDPAIKVAGGLPGSGMATWSALVLAFLAGITLNVMPCVLPVIPIKIMSILQQARQSRRRSITLGLAYAGGILGFFAVMGAVSVVARLATGAVFNLNEPFGNPWFLIAMALLLVAAALWLFGVFTVTLGGRLSVSGAGEGHVSSLGMGFITAVLATPCSGPVLVTVFGWAQGQPAWASAAVFSLLGLGMGTPHAVLAAFPSLLERMPAPGVWMERLKQAMGLILLLVAIWLISTLGVTKWVAWVAAYAVVLAGCLWMAGSWVDINTPAAKRRIVRGIAAAIAVIAGWFMLPPPVPEAIAWRPFEAAAIDAAAEDGNVVLVKFTAGWCTICKIVDHSVYNRSEIAEALALRGVVTMKADVTRNDSPAAKMLRERLAEPGPPVTVIYGPGVAEPIRLHGVFSRDELLDALDRAAGEPSR